jgi:hypothetical protein
MIRVEGVEPANHSCHVCGQGAPFGVGVLVRQGVEGKWCCREHRHDSSSSREQRVEHPAHEQKPAPCEQKTDVNETPDVREQKSGTQPVREQKAGEQKSTPRAAAPTSAPREQKPDGSSPKIGRPKVYADRASYRREWMRAKRARAASEAAA